MLRNISSLTKRRYCTSNPHLQVYLSGVNDPYYNASIEEWLFRKSDPSKQILYMWQNELSVIIGRNQDPYKECNLQNIEKDRVPLVRRYSGGGAVLHGPGNTNFSLISGLSSYSKSRNFNIVLSALKKLGVNAEVKGRNDIVVDDKKISGSAYKISNGIAVHHGTLLLDVNMSNLPRYLNPNKEKLKSKGVTSIQARVMNLKEIAPDISHDSVVRSVIEEFSKSYNSSCQTTYLNWPELNYMLVNDSSFKKILNEYKNWNWIFGSSPKCESSIEKRFNWGSIEVKFTSEAGLLNEVQIHSDSLYPEMICLLSKNLKGKRFNKLGVEEAVEKTFEDVDFLPDMTVTDKIDCKKCISEFKEWFSSTI